MPRRTASDKVLRNKVFNITKNQKYDGYQRTLASLVYKFFDIKSYGSCVKTEIIRNQFSSVLTHVARVAHVAKVSNRTRTLAEELHKPIIRKV